MPITAGVGVSLTPDNRGMSSRIPSRKTVRTLSLALNRFYKPSSIFVPSIEDLRKPDALARRFQLPGRMLMMSEGAREILGSMAKSIHLLSEHRAETTYSDTYQACLRLIEDMYEKRLRPTDGQELIELVEGKLAEQVDEHTFAVPLYGVDLIGMDSLDLGRMKIVRADPGWLRSQGVRWDEEVVRGLDPDPYKYWLVGSATGSTDVTLQLFRADAELAVGMLAISAASIHRNGATRIRIGVVMSPETAHGGADWLSWKKREKELIRHYQFRASQDFRIDGALVQQFADSGVFLRAFEVLQAPTRSELGEVLARAVHWYSDAHREVVPVMKLVKFWSCIESFFSADKKEITQSVSVGLTCVLIFGGFDFIQESSYQDTKRRVADLYDQRSKAVHAASHDHVGEKDIATLSQWVAWMLINMVSFIDRGYTRLSEVKKAGEEIDARMTASA